MAKEKSFLLEDTGSGQLYVDDVVIKMLSNTVTKRVDGVFHLTGKLSDMFNMSRRGIDVKAKEDQLYLEVSVGVKEGYKLIDVARKVQHTVIYTLQEELELQNVVVDVVVRELLVEEELEE